MQPEFEQQVENLDTVLVAVGGGGFIGGVAAWFEHRARLVGVEPELLVEVYGWTGISIVLIGWIKRNREFEGRPAPQAAGYRNTAPHQFD